MAASNTGRRDMSRTLDRRPAAATAKRPRALFICGSINQTTQLHQIAQELPVVEAHYTPYYCDVVLEIMRRLGMLNFTILGHPWRRDCMGYLERHALPVDLNGAKGPYDLVVTSSDVIVPLNIRS